MAARFVVGLALFALCHSSPVLKNGIEEIRGGRGLSVANGFASGFGNEMATANVNGNYAKSTGISNGGGALLARDGLYHQGQAHANAQTYGNEVPVGIDIARGYYHPLPVAQPAVITYNQNFPAGQLVYPVAPATAQAVANTNEASDSSLSTATNNGLGSSESNAQTSGTHGLTTTNAKTFGGYNSAASNANTRLGAASVSSEASGNGFGNGFAKSNAQTDGIVGVVPVAPIANEPTIIAAKNQGFYTPAYGSASTNADVKGHGSATSSGKTGPARRSISWHFGTAYDIPAGYGAIRSAPVVYQAAPVVYQAAPVVYTVPAEANPGDAKSNADVQGTGFAKATANHNGGLSSTRSVANSNIGGIANANANTNGNVNGYYRSSGIGAGLKSTANSKGLGNADSTANWNNGNSIANSIANSNGGAAKSDAVADYNNYGYGLYRSGEIAPWRKTISNAQSSGTGQAHGNAQAFQSGLKSADSTASSNGWGFSSANSQSL